jgi:hypothetical protein
MYLSFNHKQKNVLTTISDKKFPIDNNGLIDHYVADITSVSDYYPFGSPMDGRTFGSEKYRWGHNSHESDIEITGNFGSHYTAEFWMVDSRTVRRWEIDPVIKHYESPYAIFSNNPISFVDPDGRDIKPTDDKSRDAVDASLQETFGENPIGELLASTYSKAYGYTTRGMDDKTKKKFDKDFDKAYKTLDNKQKAIATAFKMGIENGSLAGVSICTSNLGPTSLNVPFYNPTIRSQPNEGDVWFNMNKYSHDNYGKEIIFKGYIEAYYPQERVDGHNKDAPQGYNKRANGYYPVFTPEMSNKLMSAIIKSVYIMNNKPIDDVDIQFMNLIEKGSQIETQEIPKVFK